jgi:hypothetical protein
LSAKQQENAESEIVTSDKNVLPEKDVFICVSKTHHLEHVTGERI